MMYKFTKSIACFPEKNKSDLQCGSNMMTKLEKKFGIKLHADTIKEKVNGHISIKHTNGAHVLWVFLYSDDNVHESQRDNKIIKQKSDRVKKFTGTFPTENEIKKII